MYVYFRFAIKLIKKILLIINTPINLINYYFFFPNTAKKGMILASKLENNHLYQLSLNTLKKFKNSTDFEEKCLINFFIGNILFYHYKNESPSEYFSKFFKYKSSKIMEDTEINFYPPIIYNQKIDKNINIENKIYEIRERYPTNSYSDSKQIKIYKYYQSEHNLHKLEEFQEIKKYIENIVNSQIPKIITKNNKGKFYINRMWFVISSKGISLEEHNHPEGVFSGILYIKIPPRGSSGSLILSNPRKNIKIINNNENLQIKEIQKNIILSPEINDLIIFNSYIKHSVKNQSSDEDRISLPFDLIFS